MMHKREHKVVDVANPEELANKLTQSSWCMCNGFRHAGYLYLNDATCADGAAEFGVFNEATGKQVESVTFSWCTEPEALECIKDISTGRRDKDGWTAPYSLKHPAGTCYHCA